jgi:hypothetical protein
MELLPIVRKQRKERSVHTKALMFTNIASTPEWFGYSEAMIAVATHICP